MIISHKFFKNIEIYREFWQGFLIIVVDFPFKIKEIHE